MKSGNRYILVYGAKSYRIFILIDEDGIYKKPLSIGRGFSFKEPIRRTIKLAKGYFELLKPLLQGIIKNRLKSKISVTMYKTI